MKPVAKLKIKPKQVLLLSCKEPGQCGTRVICPLEFRDRNDGHHIYYSAYHVLLFERLTLAAVGKASEVDGD